MEVCHYAQVVKQNGTDYQFLLMPMINLCIVTTERRLVSISPCVRVGGQETSCEQSNVQDWTGGTWIFGHTGTNPSYGHTVPKDTAQGGVIGALLPAAQR